MAVAQPLLRDGSMDFAIGPLHGAQAAQEFACEKLLDYDTAVLVRQGHPLAGCGSIHELLEQDWALNYTGDGHDALMRELFWRHGALIDERRIVRAHSVAILQTLVEQADMCTWVPAIRRRPAVARPGGAAGAAGNLRATTAGHHHPARRSPQQSGAMLRRVPAAGDPPPRPLGEEG